MYKISTLVSADTTSADEVQKFGLLSSEWWNQAGDFDALKAMNKLRVPWIKNVLLKDSGMNLIKPLDSFKILDVGCGGGLLSEVRVFLSETSFIIIGIYGCVYSFQ